MDGASAKELMDSVLPAFARATGFPVVFGGLESGGVATVSSLLGNRTGSLMGLRVRIGRGLGGRAMEELRPRLTSDYYSSPYITHDYDREVRGEGITALLAYPVVVQGRARAVLYGGSPTSGSPGNLFAPEVSALIEDLAREIRIHDEVQRRLPYLNHAEAPREMPTAKLEELRESYAELRGISASVQDPELRDRLVGLESRLARLSGLSPTPAETAVKLSPRERDVLAHVALGSTNAEVGQALGLTEGTVKAYLKSAAAKLGCSTRHAAVLAARRAALIP